MAGLRTLGEIVAYMDSQLPGQNGGQSGGQNGGMPRGQNGSVPGAEVGFAAAATDPPAAADAIMTQDPIRRYVLQTVERPAPGLTPPFLLDGTTVYITDDGRGVAHALAQRLQAAGADARVCAEAPAGARAIICLAGLAAGDAEAAVGANAAAFAAAVAAAPAMETQGGLFVTVQDTGGDYGLAADPGPRAWFGGLSGLAKTAAQEWPRAVVRTLDLATGLADPRRAGETGAESAADIAAARLAGELLTGGTELEIGLPADGRRLGFVAVDVPAAGAGVTRAPAVDEQSVIVVTGGGRGVTAAALIALAQAARPRIAILGRTPLTPEPQAVAGIQDDAGIKKALLAAAQAQGQKISPKELGAAAERITAQREIRSTLLALAAAGAQATYIPCDVGDPQATAAALAAVREQWGPITGIVHGAGVLADKRLAEKTPADFRRVFGAKVDGLRSLLAATQDDPLNVICLFSSVAGRTGNAGQADYAMANEVLNRVAQAEAKRRPLCVVKSIGWGPWAGGMVTPLLKAKFDELGVPLIPLATGAAAFVAELQAASPAEVETVIGGMPQAAPLLAQGSGAQGTEKGAAGTIVPFVYDVAVSAATHPFLWDHQVNGVVVLPLVLVGEWLLRAAAAAGVGGPGGTLENLRVRKGLPLADFGDRPLRLRLRGVPRADRPGAWELALLDAEGAVRFTATAVRREAPDTQRPPAAGGTLGDAARKPTLAAAELYGRELFHGPHFAALQACEQIDSHGAAARLVGSAALGWPQDGWHSDPALIDGALQLARVWGYALLGRPTLPTACARLTIRRPGILPAGPLHCVVAGKSIGGAGTRSDLWLIDPADQSVVAEIEGLEMYVSSEPPAAGHVTLG
jgi:NAD(P)-dependent dehydrogenase (short-subunit alcohol dehydrogenase family)